MKKNLILGMVLSSVVCIGGTAFAANPFDDVPKNHWSYDAVNQLVTAGIIVGDNNQFNGDRPLTRYEIAVIVGRTMANEKKANAAQKTLIDKLSREYKSELESMGVRLDEMQKQIDRVTFQPLVRIRYDDKETGHWVADGGTSKGKVGSNDWGDNAIDRNMFFQMGFNYKFGDDWNAKLKLNSQINFFGDDLATAFSTPAVETGYVEGPLFKGTFTAGKFENTPGHQLIYDNNTSGSKYSFNLGKIKAMMFYGVPEDKDGTKVFGTQFKYAMSPATNIAVLGAKGKKDGAGTGTGAGWVDHQWWDLTYYGNYANGGDWNPTSEFPWGESSSDWDYAARRSIEIGVDTKINKNIVLSGAHAKSNADGFNNAYMVRLDYKGAKSDAVGSYGLFAKYAKVESYSAIALTTDHADNVYPNEKGIMVGFAYTPMKNATLSASYFDGDYLTYSTQSNYSHEVKRSRIQMEISF